MTATHTDNSLNSVILANIQKEKRKFYTEIKKLLTKYGFQDEVVSEDRILNLEAENKKLRQEMRDLQKTCDDLQQTIQEQRCKILDNIDHCHVPTSLNKKYFIHGNECSDKEFEKYLRDTSTSTVFVTLFYENKPATQHVWQVTNFTQTSNLSGNLHSGFLRGWKTKQITGIKLETK